MRSHRRPNIAVVILFLLALTAAIGRADDAYFNVAVSSLHLTEGKLPPATEPSDDQDWAKDYLSWPRVILDGPGEAYVGADKDDRAWNANPPAVTDLQLRATAPAGTALKGRLLLPKADAKAGVDEVRFEIPAASADKDARKPFFIARARYYQRLLSDSMPGGAWFRHQLNESLKAIDKQDDPSFSLGGGSNRDADLDETYALFTGSRAISENLQLHRAMPAATQHSESPVKTDSIKGIEVKAIDWKPLIKDATAQTDPLAAMIPIDQPAAIFPSMKQLTTVLDAASRHSKSALRTLDPQSSGASLFATYGRQLCHTMADLSALADAGLIDSVAITASDTYIQAGTDIAIIMQSKKANELRDRLAKKIAGAQDAKPAGGDADGLAYAGAVSPHRAISAYVAVLDGAVVLTNSTAQLEHLAAVKKGTSQPLSAAPEYAFFRNRYAIGADDESAFVILTDATIRKWCSARWRIADSRRTRAAAVLAELTAQNSDALVNKTAETKPLTTTLSMENPGAIELSPAGVSSSTYNSLAFMTPIAELDLPEVTKSEASAYQRWRDGYQRDWNWAFDPIAMRVSVAHDHLRGDFTVMPLIDFSDYKEMVDASRGAILKPGTGDPHDALAQYAYAINIDSEPMKQLATMASTFIPNLRVNPFAWVGQTISLYADDDPFWKELAASKSPQEFVDKNVGRLPVALNVQVRDGMKAVLFLTALRGFVDGAAPGMARWEPQNYNGRAYVKISATDEGRKSLGEDVPDFSLFYSISADGFVITPNEAVLKRALDRQIARNAATSQPAVAAKLPATRPWLGKNLALQFTGTTMDLITHFSDYQSQRQAAAWSRIPILNEYKHLYPNADPAEIYQRLWAMKLPGKFAWSDTWQTMQSTAFGSPEEPKNAPDASDFLSQIRDGNFGVDFESQGIRARGDIDLAPPAATPAHGDESP